MADILFFILNLQHIQGHFLPRPQNYLLENDKIKVTFSSVHKITPKSFPYSTVTDLAKFLGLSTSKPFSLEI